MMVVQVAGPDCELCRAAMRRIEQAICEGGLEVAVERITDFDDIVALKVYAVPGVLVDGVLKSVARVPEQHEVRQWLAGSER